MADVILYFGQEVPKGDIKSLKELEGVSKIKEVSQKFIQVFYEYPKVTIKNLLNRVKEADKVRVIGL